MGDPMSRRGDSRSWASGSLLSSCFTASAAARGSAPRSDHHEHGDGHGGVSNTSGIPIVSFKWHHVEPPYYVALWVMVCFMGKLAIEANHHVTEYVPESALLICWGFISGGMIWGADKVQTFSLTPTVFFFYSSPQVISDAGYTMPNKLFFTNMGGISIYAIIGTCWNAASVGSSSWGCHKGGAMGDIEIGSSQYLSFGSLIAAVDPVAVLAVFEQVHVNDILFIMVFGESSLNDGVTVVLFNVFDSFVSLGGAAIDAKEVVKGIISFFVVAFGGSSVGFVFGSSIAMLTRCTKNVQIIEPGFIFVSGYLSYLTAEMLSSSAILSILFCGMCCQKYINSNMAETSVETVRYAMKVFANGSETIIFVFLGITAIDKNLWVWNTGFILLTSLFVLVHRFIGVFVLTWIYNRFRLVKISLVDQIVMGYGGSRGAVAYGLAMMSDENKVKEKNSMVSTTLIVVYFTVILQGSTSKPLVQWSKVKRATHVDLSLIEKLQNKVFDHMSIAMEDISGQILGDNYMRGKWKIFESKWMSWVLSKPSARKKQDRLFEVFHQSNSQDAMEYVTEGERRGSSEFIRNENAIIDFKKKLGGDSDEAMPDIMADMGDDVAGASGMRRDPVPSVSLEMHEQNMRGLREAEAINCHHLSEQHLYKGRKEHRYRFSRNHSGINQDEDEVQEIFQRTMRSRSESFKSGKMGVAPPKTITKHTKREQQPKMANGKNRAYYSGDEDFEFSEGDSASGYSSIPRRFSYRAGAGIENPGFMPDTEPSSAVHIPPWSADAESEADPVAPSERAQVRSPWMRGHLHRSSSSRTSTRSSEVDDVDSEDSPPPPPPRPPHRDDERS